MAKKTISNTFTVSTVEDGESAPYYFQEWFAWSSVASTNNVTTSPFPNDTESNPNPAWSTSIPENTGGLAYLWRKSIRYVWNENTRQYSEEAAQYFRMSGTNGTSINTKGTIKVAITASGTFPTAGFSSGDLGIKQGDSYIWKFNGSSWSHVSSASSNGDSYTMTKDCTIDLDGDGTPENIKGHLIQWSTEASKWIDLGQFKGESGVTYYTHIAWATKVNYNSSGEVTSVEGFTPDKSPNDTTHIWMGTYVDTNSGQDSANASLYTWSYTKGVQGNQGNDAVRYELVPSVNVITLSEDEVPTFDQVFFSLYRSVGSNNPTIYSTVQQWQNGLFKLYYVVDGVQTEVDYDYMLSYDTKVNYHDIESLYDINHDVTWVVKKNNSVVAQLSMGVVKNGDAGKDAQYIYLKGTARDANNSITTHIPPVINVNGGTNLAIYSRGLNLVTINRQTLAMVDSINYDTYGEAFGVSGATGITDLITKLNTLDDSVFVCLVSCDAIGWSDNLIAALQGYGMGDLPYTATGRYPFLFIGYKNIGKGNGLTRMRNVGSYTNVVELSVYIANGALTIKDGDTVQAQYAPNSNPTSSQIHTTWQNGDLYMRTRQSYETTWSSWHKIVGENGGETDYTFNISKSLTSSSAITAPANCYYNTWQDAPVAPTSDYPYLWMKIVKKTWNESTQSYDSGTPSYARITGEKGENAFVVDLENEMTNLELDEIGNTTEAIDFYFKVQAYYGTRNVLNDCTITASCEDADVTVTTTAAKTTGIRVQISQGIDMTGTTDISVTVTHPTYGARTVVFTMAGIKDGKNAVLQELLPSLDAISFARQDDGSLSPDNRSLSLSIKKTQGGVTTIQTLAEANLTIRWSASSMPATASDGNNWGNGTSTGISWNSITMNIANNASASNIYIAAFKFVGVNTYVLVDRETIPVIKDGKHGTSPYFADLNNEMDAIQCKHDGGVIADQTVSAVISMWKGSAVEPFAVDNIYRNGTQLMWDGNNNGVWPRILSGGTTLAIEFDTNASISNIDDFKITIHSTNDTSVTRELHFTINGVRSNAIYRLVPSHSQIVKKKDGTYEPSVNITCSVEKNENGSTSTPSSSEYTLEKSVNGNPYEEYSATAPSSITSDLKFRLTVDGVVVDLETIPLVSDGNKGDNGDDAPAVFANPEKITIQCNPNGSVKAQVSTTIAFTFKVGTHSATIISYAVATPPSGVTVNESSSTVPVINVSTSATASGMANGVTFTVVGSYDGKNYSAKVTVALIGSTQGGTGLRGKIGRFFYYAGAWNDFASTDDFDVTDAQAPYFSYNNGYWVFNPETNGTYTKQDMGTPSSSSSNWEIMTNDFKYIITEAIFGSYAHFGGAIINGDWMLSQHGTINGVASTSYTNFDPSHPNDNTGTNFIPNYCVDLLTGTVYQQNAFVKGTIEADSGHIGGFIINSTQIKSLNNSIVFNSDGSAVIANGTFTGAINGQVVICGNSNQEGKIYIQPDVYIEEEPGSGIHTAKIRGEFGTLDFHSFELFATQDDAEFILASPTNELNLTENTLRIDTTSFINSITYSTGVFVRVGDYNDNVILRFYKNDGTSLPVSTTQQPPSDVSVGQVYVYQDASNSGQLRIKLSL